LLSCSPIDRLAQASKIMLSIAILLTHPLQFYCAIEFTWPKLAPKIEKKFPRFSGVLGEYIYRITLILITSKCSHLS
jgi:Sec-independent protein secretion pathway component TatC